MLKEYDQKEAGVVAHCFTGHRFKLRFDKPKMFIMFSLNSLKTFSRNSEDEEALKYYEKAQNFAEKFLLQRDVIFKIQSIDKYGNAHGDMTVDGKNIAVPLLKKGLAYVS